MKFVELIKEMKAQGKGLMSEVQYVNVGYILSLLSPCNLLVFGLGEDATIWDQINIGGRTVFLEDDADWISKFTDRGLEIHEVAYDTKAEEHEKIGFDPEKLAMKLPPEVSGEKWDVVLVDAPLGHSPPRSYKGPGRMQSIYAAHTLLAGGGICIVDDFGREIERKYSLHFFGKDNLYNVIEDKVAIFKKSLEDANDQT